MRKKAFKTLGWLLKMAILIGTFVLIYRSLAENDQLNQEFMATIQHALGNASWGYLAAIFALIFANWMFEGAKWQIMASKIEPISFFQAFKGVLAGLAMAFASATYAGGFMGRVWHLKSESRYEVLGAALLNMLTQNFVTYTWGLFSLLYFLSWKDLIASNLAYGIGIYLAIVTPITGWLLLRGIKMVERLQRFKWLYKYMRVLGAYSRQEILRITFFAFCRYLSYFVQFLLIMHIYGIHLPLVQQLTGIALVYFAKAVIPNFSVLTDLGIREFSALQFLGEDGYGVANVTVITSTVTVWLINVLFPVALGAYFVLQLRFFPKEKAPHSEALPQEN